MITAVEELSPTLENLVVLTWLRLIQPDLPGLVKQHYGTGLRSRALASLKPEISQALDSLIEEIRSTADSKVLLPPPQDSDSFLSPSPSIYPHLPSTKTTTLCVLLLVQFHAAWVLNSRPTSRLSISIIHRDSPLTGAETSMIKSSLARSIGAPINQSFHQADGVTPLAVAGETHLILSRADK